MSTIAIHVGQPHLPLSLDTATAVLGLGLVVFGVIAYDLYRHWWLGGDDGWQ